MFEIECKTTLVTMQILLIRSTTRARHTTPLFRPIRRLFDFDDIRTPIRKQTNGTGASPRVGEVQHSDVA